MISSLAYPQQPATESLEPPMRTRPSIRSILAVITLPASLAGQSAKPSAARHAEIPAAYSAIREADLRHDVGEMASPAMRGREGGTIDEMRASVWVAEQYRKIGLKPKGDDSSYYQWFDMTRTRVSVTASSASIGGRAMALFQDMIPTAVVPVTVSAPVFWVDNPSDTSVDVRGKIVATTVLTPAPAAIRANSYTFASRYADAAINGTVQRFARRGAAAVILVANPAVDSAFRVVSDARVRGSYDVDNAIPRNANGSMRIAPPPTAGTGQTPAFLVHAAMHDVLTKQPQAQLDIRLERFTVPSVNVIGMVRGTDPKLRDEYVLFSSHQDANGVRWTLEGDSVHAGADDNASVSAAILAAARAFVKQPGKRSVLFIHHAAEGGGLMGSGDQAAHPVVPL